MNVFFFFFARRGCAFWIHVIKQENCITRYIGFAPLHVHLPLAFLSGDVGCGGVCVCVCVCMCWGGGGEEGAW